MGRPIDATPCPVIIVTLEVLNWRHCLASMMATVFISHSSYDKNVANTICDALENRGLKCWIANRDVNPGENFQLAIVRAIRAAKVMVLVFTESAQNSDEIKKELALASRYRLMVIPARAEDVLPRDELELEFATRQYIDLFQDWENGVKRLAEWITRTVSVEKEKTAPAKSLEAKAPDLTEAPPAARPSSSEPVAEINESAATSSQELPRTAKASERVAENVGLSPSGNVSNEALVTPPKGPAPAELPIPPAETIVAKEQALQPEAAVPGTQTSAKAQPPTTANVDATDGLNAPKVAPASTAATPKTNKIATPQVEKKNASTRQNLILAVVVAAVLAIGVALVHWGGWTLLFEVIGTIVVMIVVMALADASPAFRGALFVAWIGFLIWNSFLKTGIDLCNWPLAQYWNPNYHNACDRSNTFNLPTFPRMPPKFITPDGSLLNGQPKLGGAANQLIQPNAANSNASDLGFNPNLRKSNPLDLGSVAGSQLIQQITKSPAGPSPNNGTNQH